MQHTPESDQNDFEELLSVLQDEELYRVRHRLNKKRKIRLVDIVTEEIRFREALRQEEGRRHAP